MILASYPRSGSTLARLLFRHLLGQQTASVYPEARAPASYRRALGVVPDADRQGLDGVWWKTHRVPDEPLKQPTIVVVRNGRTVMQSMHAYYRDVLKQDVSLESIVAGGHKWGCWSAWLRAWRQLVPHAWVVHYEDMVAQPQRVAERIAWRFDLPEPAGELPGFDELLEGFPAFFRRGQVAPELWPDDIEQLFLRHHKPTMAFYGYR